MSENSARGLSITSIEAAQRRAREAAAAAGLAGELRAPLDAGLPALHGEFTRDSGLFGDYWSRIDPILTALAGAEGAAQRAQGAVRELACLSRLAFLDRHAETLYRHLTDDLARFRRVDEICYGAADLLPGLAPTRGEVTAELQRRQGAKIGLEMYQGMLLSAVLAKEECGHHLCHAMLLPRAESAAALERFAAEGRLKLEKASLHREGKAAMVTLSNPDVLNSEDDTVTADLETAIDVAILDTETQIAVLRGAPVPHPKYDGQRLFGSGINLTRLYEGRIPFLFYLERDLGLVNKLLRGLADPARDPAEEAGGTREKLWMAALDGFAIGGACQLLLAVDFTLAADNAYLSLPARKEGIIPGCANLRLPRFVGDRIARQAIFYDRKIPCDSAQGRMICDEVVAPEAMDEALAGVVATLTSSGVVSAEGNRRAFRVGQEPLDVFRRYCAVMAREQAFCHFSPALTANLEANWIAPRGDG